ncbi:shikimate dehydrogenase [candidate division KSB1 bacterium]|nr:shikimate dehydrogenase [candidate division KSB1 bacterium]
MANPPPRLLGVIGDPIEHSLSPLIHNYLLAQLHLSGYYQAFRITAADLPQLLPACRLLNLSGLNVTIPHKLAIYKLVDHLTPTARQIGAVNTVYRRGNDWWGDNTDGIGFCRSLGPRLQGLRHAPVIVLGAGGAARAIVASLIAQHVGRIYIFNRRRDRAESLVQFFKMHLNFDAFSIHAWDDTVKLQSVMRQAFMLINTTPVGMFPNMAANPLVTGLEIPAALLVYDLIYNPEITLLLKQAQQAGAEIINGLDMLIYQAVAALEIWFEQKLEVTDFLPPLRQRLRITLEASQNQMPD